MCGRFALAIGAYEAQVAFPTFIFPDAMPERYNIAPGQPVLALPNTGEKRPQMCKWGLIPPWAKDPKMGSRLINARSETLSEKPSFRSAYKRRRCIVPATGFYEWQRQKEGQKVPMYIALQSGQPFGFAGLWETWFSPDGSELDTCTIITTEPNTLTADIHSRMPVILPPESYSEWLSPNERNDLQDLLKPFPAEAMTAHAVSPRVNAPTNDDSDCIKPAMPPEQGTLF